jgi:PAS domain S-box-containing protein
MKNSTTETALSQSEERFRLLVDSVQDYAIFMLDPQGRVATWNTGAQRIKGYTAAEIIGQHFSRFYPAQVIAEKTPDQELEVALRDGRFEDEGWRVRKDGTQFWANVVITPLRNAQGELVGFAKITRDLTERRRQEVALRESEARLRMLVEAARDYAIFMLDPEGRVLSWNPGAESIKGYKEAEIIGSHFSRFYPEEVVASGWPEHELRTAKELGRFEDEGWRVRKDGSRFWASVVITALKAPDGTLLGYSKITRDLTPRRHAEERLRESEERFRLLVDSVKDYAIFMLDPDGNILSWNSGAERIKGYKADEVLGSNFSRFYTPESVAAGWPQHELKEARREGHFEDQGWRVRKDHSMFWADVVISAIYDEQNKLRGFAKVTRDMTDQKRVETLEEGKRQTTEFLAMLAHELRNPLAPIRNAVQIMANSGIDTTAREWCRNVIDRQVSQLSRLVDDLLDVTRITSGKIVLQKEDMDLNEAVTRAVEAVRPQLEARKHSFTLSLCKPSLTVDGDVVRLSQAVLNLLHNAAKYTPEGGQISCVVSREGDAAVVTVGDTGIGIPGDLMPRIFELFIQGERGLDRSEGGLGVGLTLVDRLVRLHGGSVVASSAGADRGSQFVIRLPLAPKRQPAQAMSEPSLSIHPVPKRVSRRVLIVEDNRDAADTMAAAVRAWGHQSQTSYDGSEALAGAAEFKPQVILLDIGLPRMTGYEVAKRLRQLPGVGGAMIIAVSGYGQEEDRERGREAGIDHHFTKPVDLDELEALLASYEPASIT